MPSDIGNHGDEIGAVLPSKIEQQTYEKDLYAQRIAEIPSNMQKRLDYGARTDSNPVYVGYAPRGLAEGVDGWLLYYLEYDGSNRLTKLTVAYGDWTSHATESYA